MESPGDMARPNPPTGRSAGGHATHVFLAPHYDDVALSCGGTVAALADAGAHPLIVTIFGGEPASDDLTAFARWQHERWGTGADDTIATRLREDRAAAAILGCETRTLPFLDAIYRGDGYLSDEALFGAILPVDADLAARIADALLALPDAAPPAATTYYAPLAIGEHVDHQLVYKAGRSLAARGARVLAYEDFPYAALGDAARRRIAALAGDLGEPELLGIGETLDRRIAAIAAYRSQLPVIFRFTDDWPAVVRTSARFDPPGSDAAERFWPLRSRG